MGYHCLTWNSSVQEDKQERSYLDQQMITIAGCLHWDQSLSIEICVNTCDVHDNSFKMLASRFVVIFSLLPLIGVDTCRLKSKYLGVLLFTNYLNENNLLFTITFCGSWIWVKNHPGMIFEKFGVNFMLWDWAFDFYIRYADISWWNYKRCFFKCCALDLHATFIEKYEKNFSLWWWTQTPKFGLNNC